MDFDRWLQRFVTKTEKILFRLTLVLVVLLFVVQAALLKDGLRVFLSKTEQLEGQPVQTDSQEVFGRNVFEQQQGILGQEEKTKTALVLELSSSPGQEVELFLLINNEVAAQLGAENLYIPVAPGDMLEVMGKVTGSSPAIVSVSEVYGQITAPPVGHEIATFGERELLGWVIP